MLNTQKLLYVLPDLAYIAELLPDKKPHAFAIQSFKQVNGEFLNETEFIAENIAKLISKLEEGEEYFLILPDFLFTNTIVSIKETSEAKIKEVITQDTLPGLGIKDETHLIETVHLNQLKGTTRVQLSAIEKSILSIFKAVLAEKDIKIAGVSPLSWAVKSLISLEPSISVLQLGTNLYTAQHYIGVDQTTTAAVDSPDNVIETIKTLKGAEPSIQTVYVCTNAVIEEKLKHELSKILPIQQMAIKDDSEKMPSYVSQVITSTMRTLAIPDFSVPTFKLGKPTEEEKRQYASLLTASATAIDEDEDDIGAELPKPKISPTASVTADEDESEDEKASATESTEPEHKEADITPETALPDIETIQEADEQAVHAPDIDDLHDAEETSVSVPPSAAHTATSIASTIAAVPPAIVPVSDSEEADEDKGEPPSEMNKSADEPDSEPKELKAVDEDQKADTIGMPVTEPASVTTAKTVIPPSERVEKPPVVSTPNDDIDLKQFAQNGETAVQTSDKPVIKNKSGAQHMMKMILITTGVFIVTVAIGIGVGLAILKYSGEQNTIGAPVVEVEQPSPTPQATVMPTASPEASPAAALDKSKLQILVINATTKAGYAGQIKTKLTTAEFENITTGNAKGDYTKKGNFVYLKEENQALMDEVAKATNLSFVVSEDVKVEDPQGKYDAVLVLAE